MMGYTYSSGLPTSMHTSDNYAITSMLMDTVSGCGNRYSREHQGKQPTQLLMIHMGDHGEVLMDKVIQAIELLNEPAPAATNQECCVLSTHLSLA